eukprot:TRINITY_DN16796_c0_g1_i12.p1 TRINITY_DN16796_c0_g1~~TRINITY_DN16796_c0_g1_i12.p1  ORF type:complete len:793 (-),score=225.29 TRINITY_DN16796_c0_g1_i12:27-2366(-)
MQNLLSDPTKKNVFPPGEASPADVDKLYKDVEAGPRSAAHLRELAAEGKKLGSPDEVAEKVKDAERLAKKRRKQAKAALREYLNQPDCPAFTPAGNKSKPEVTPADVNDLFKNEKSGLGTAALLDVLEAGGQKFDSIPDLLDAAAVVSAQKRKELGDHLADPKCPLFSDVKDKVPITPEAVARLAEESEAGPATLPVLKDLEAAKTKVPNSDEAIPLVKRAFKNKKPKGAATKAVEDAIAAGDNQNTQDVQALMDHLAGPDIQMMDGSADMKEKDVEAALEAAGSLPEAIAAVDALNEDGESFSSVPELVDAIKDRRIMEQGVKDELKELLPAYVGPVTATEVDALYDKGGAGLDTAAIVRELLEEGKKPSSPEELADAVKDLHRKKQKAKKQDKEALRDYLADPACPLFTPTGNSTKEIGPGDVNKLFGNEKTGPGTGALLNALEESGKKYDSVPELLAAAKDLSKQRKKDMLDHLNSSQSPLIDDKTGDKPQISEEDVKKIAKESTAGPAALELLKELEASGFKAQQPEDLIAPIKDLHDKKRKVPRAKLGKTERVAGEGESPLDARAGGSGDSSDADVEAMMNYLRDPDHEVLDPAGSAEIPDVKQLLDEAGGLKEAVPLCDYLGDEGKSFGSVPEITAALPSARDRREREKKEMKEALNDPKCKLAGGKPLTDAQIDKLHDDGGAGPHTGTALRELEAEGKAFPTPEALAEAVKEKERARKQRRKKDKKALQDYLASPSCDLFTPSGNRSKEDVPEIGRAVQQECRDRSRMPSSA